MKKILTTAACFSLCFGSLTIATTANAQASNSNNALVNICKEYIAEYPDDFKNLGECASLAAKICNDAKKQGLFPLEVEPGVVLRNQGDCVNYVKSWY